jgi:CTP:molybdopterin cytidylyltransferase MocA
MKNYAAIILAAGYSSRMGEFKPLMDLDGKTPFRRCIDLFRNSGITEIIVITGYLSDRIKETMEDSIRLKDSIKMVVNNKYSEGMFSSIKAGVKELSKDTDAFFILPVDIPSVKEHTIEKMIESYEKIHDGILFPTFNEKKGHPTLISCTLVEEILTKDPEGGLREILNDHKDKWNYKAVDDRGILLDMDTKDDFKILYEHIVMEYKKENL